MLLAGVSAGILSTLAQWLAWLLAGADAWGLLWRDARLTAALVLGLSVLPPPATFDAGILLVASGVHFLLSILYAALLWPLRRTSTPASLLVGVLFGGALYLVNLYGFTVIFPWFVHARGGATLAAHLVFGLAVMLTYCRLGVQARRHRHLT